MSTIASTELFDGSQYEIPFPKIDGKDVNELALSLGGHLKLDRHNEEHVHLIESLTLGRYVTFTVTASVASKGQTVKIGEDSEIVTHQVGLKLHSIEQSA